MFTHTLHRAGDTVYVHRTGELDLSDRARLRNAVIAASAAQPGVLRVDVAGVEFIDCAAVATLLGLRAAAAAAGTCPSAGPDTTGVAATRPRGRVQRPTPAPVAAILKGS